VMWSRHGAWGPGEWIAMSLMMVVLWAAFIALIVWLVHFVRSDQRTDTAVPRQSHADEVLAERYARGEVDDDDEYGRRRLVLHGGVGRSR
jgi:putative membrane protein